MSILPRPLAGPLGELRTAVEARDVDAVATSLLSYRAAVLDLEREGRSDSRWDLDPTVYRKALVLLLGDD